VAGAGLSLLVACSSSDPTVTGTPGGKPGTDPTLPPALSCGVNENSLFSGGPGRDGIPALVNPPLVPANDPQAAYLDRYAVRAQANPAFPTLRVVGLELNGVPVAIPHNVLWWHEIVNIETAGGGRVTVSYCPLTGSALAFDAGAAGVSRFGVSGLIFQNNLVMFDDETGSLWPQMCLSARFGQREGDALIPLPTVEMEWTEWKARHPATLVISEQTGFDRDYTAYPYNGYESNDFLLFGLPRALDTRRTMKERVLGIPASSGGFAIPFDELNASGPLNVIRTTADGEEIVVFWDQQAQAAVAFRPRTTGGQVLTLRSQTTRFVDAETGSTWNVEGEGLSGPLAGQHLEPYPQAYVAFWFAWASFYPRTDIWQVD